MAEMKESGRKLFGVVELPQWASSHPVGGSNISAICLKKLWQKSFNMGIDEIFFFTFQFLIDAHANTSVRITWNL